MDATPKGPRKWGAELPVILPVRYGSRAPGGLRERYAPPVEHVETARWCIQAVRDEGRCSTEGTVAVAALWVARELLAVPVRRSGRRFGTTTTAEREWALVRGLATVATADSELVLAAGFASWLGPEAIRLRLRRFARWTIRCPANGPDWEAIRVGSLKEPPFSAERGLRCAAHARFENDKQPRLTDWDEIWESALRSACGDRSAAAADILDPIVGSDRGLVVFEDGTLAPNFGTAIDLARKRLRAPREIPQSDLGGSTSEAKEGHEDDVMGPERVVSALGAIQEAREADRERRTREVRSAVEAFRRDRLALPTRSHARAIRWVRRHFVAMVLDDLPQATVAEEAGCSPGKVSEAFKAEYAALVRDPRMLALSPRRTEG